MQTHWFSHSRACPMKVGRDVWGQGEKEMLVFLNLSLFQIPYPCNAKLSQKVTKGFVGIECFLTETGSPWRSQTQFVAVSITSL